MTGNGKAQILSELLKMNRAFRARHIVEQTGLSRQLVNHHLSSMVTDGSLEKDGVYYTVADRDSLINAVATIDDGPSMKKAHSTQFINEELVKALNTIARIIVSSRNTKAPFHREVKEFMVNEIDDTIRSYKNLRKYITAKTMTPKVAQTNLPKDAEEAWGMFGRMLQGYTDKDTFIKEWEEWVEE